MKFKAIKAVKTETPGKLRKIVALNAGKIEAQSKHRSACRAALSIIIERLRLAYTDALSAMCVIIALIMLAIFQPIRVRSPIR
jgi:hypothetical protein